MILLTEFQVEWYSISIITLLIWHLLTLIIPLLISIAYLTLLERKQISAIQGRKGPNIVGIFGLLQPLADGLKLFIKELIIPSKSNTILFLLAPCITFSLSLISWIVIPLCMLAINIELGVLFILAVSSLAVYAIVIAGWSSNSNYALLGALRSTAQMISYEVSIGLLFIPIIMCVGSLNFDTITEYQYNLLNVFHLLPVFILFFISSLAETNRAPFDLPEAEAELVAGYNVEYSGMAFALFFLGEYNNMIVISAIMVFIFLGGWYLGGLFTFLTVTYILFTNPVLRYLNMQNNITHFFVDLYYATTAGFSVIVCTYIDNDHKVFLYLFRDFLYPWEFHSYSPWYIFTGVKIIFILYLFILTRASLPRYRYDQLMQIGWKMILPFSIIFVTVTAYLYGNIVYTSFLNDAIAKNNPLYNK
jgi:NADH-quinone oxidoreductase subunit H